MRIPELDTSFDQNLAAYVEANEDSSPSDFRVKRELDVARHALEESLALHTAVTRLVKSAISNLSDSQDDLVRLISYANNLEERHRKLQNSAKTVAAIAKSGAEIESLLSSKLDAAQVYSIIVQLPNLLLSLLQIKMLEYMQDNGISLRTERTNGRELSERQEENVVVDLANFIANAFNEEVERNVSVLTYRDSDDGKVDSKNPDGSLGVIEQQVVAMLNTVPLNSDNNSDNSEYSCEVVEEDSKQAQAIRELENQ